MEVNNDTDSFKSTVLIYFFCVKGLFHVSSNSFLMSPKVRVIVIAKTFSTHTPFAIRHKILQMPLIESHSSHSMAYDMNVIQFSYSTAYFAQGWLYKSLISPGSQFFFLRVFPAPMNFNQRSESFHFMWCVQKGKVNHPKPLHVGGGMRKADNRSTLSSKRDWNNEKSN